MLFNVAAVGTSPPHPHVNGVLPFSSGRTLGPEILEGSSTYGAFSCTRLPQAKTLEFGTPRIGLIVSNEWSWWSWWSWACTLKTPAVIRSAVSGAVTVQTPARVIRGFCSEAILVRLSRERGKELKVCRRGSLVLDLERNGQEPREAKRCAGCIITTALYSECMLNLHNTYYLFIDPDIYCTKERTLD
jgi:hypothetical protein